MYVGRDLLSTSFTDAAGNVIPSSGNGRRLTIAFWIYINDMSAYRSMYRHVLHRGDKGITNASPLVYIDKDTNKLIVRFDTAAAATVAAPTRVFCWRSG